MTAPRRAGAPPRGSDTPASLRGPSLPRRRTRLRWPIAAGSLVLLGGCQGRQLSVHPDPPPGTATWLAVWIAAGLAATVLGALVVGPATFRDRRIGPGRRAAVALLGLQTGALAVGIVLLAGIAVRSEQLMGRSPDQLPATALLELSAIGDGRFAQLLLVGTVLFLGLPAVVTALSVRLAASDDVPQRWMACVVLVIQTGAGLLAAGVLVAGGRGPWLVVALLNGALAGAACAACWPPRPDAAAPPPAPGPWWESGRSGTAAP